MTHPNFSLQWVDCSARKSAKELHYYQLMHFTHFPGLPQASLGRPESLKNGKKPSKTLTQWTFMPAQRVAPEPWSQSHMVPRCRLMHTSDRLIAHSHFSVKGYFKVLMILLFFTWRCFGVVFKRGFHTVCPTSFAFFPLKAKPCV